MRIIGRTKATLYKKGKIRMNKQELSHIVGFLYNHNLIDLSDKKFWIDMGNDYVIDMKKRYGRIYQEQDKIINKKYKIVLESEPRELKEESK